MPALLASRRVLFDRGFDYAPLTLSGNEVTDRIRATADQGDGLTDDGSTGVWPAATNRAINSNAKTNTTSIIDVGATTTRETTGLVGADTTRFKTVTANAATAEGTSQLIDGGAGSTQYTFSVWLAGTGTVKLYISDTVGGKQLGSQITLTATPTKYSVTATTGALGITETCGWETDSQQGITVTHGRWMCETGAIATPHVLTDGAQATRAAGRVQQPVAGALVSATGSIVMRFRPHYAQDGAPATNLGYWEWALDGTNQLRLLFSAGSFTFRTRAGGAAADVSQAITFAAESGNTVAAMWSPLLTKVSCNGAASTTQAPAANQQPDLSSVTLADLMRGPVSLGSFAYADMLWFATFATVLSDTESAYLHSLGNAGPPRLSALPGHPTSLWDAVGNTFQRRR